MPSRLSAAAVAISCVLAAPVLSAFELRPATLAAFERYVRVTEARMTAEVEGRSPFLWIDRQPAGVRAALVERLTRGEVVSERLETRDGTTKIEASHGLIHHWIGTVLLPGVTIDRARAFVEDYERYPALFGPAVVRARILKRAPDRFDVAMRTSMKKVITVVVDADYAVQYRRLGPSRLYTRSVATNLFDVDAAGEPGERRTPVEQGRGFLWRLNTYCWFEERPEGTYEQCESISLTSNIPWYAVWIKPFVTGIPRETLEFTLGRVRSGVAATRGPLLEPPAQLRHDGRHVIEDAIRCGVDAPAVCHDHDAGAGPRAVVLRIAHGHEPHATGDGRHRSAGA
jgi:hypothetical protein